MCDVKYSRSGQHLDATLKSRRELRLSWKTIHDPLRHEAQERDVKQLMVVV